MTTQETLDALTADGVAEGITLFEGPQDAALVVPAERLHDVCRHLRDRPAYSFEQCILVTGTHFPERRNKDGDVERPEGFEVIYHLRSLRHRRVLALKVSLTGGEHHLPSVADLWQAADWHERETWDMLGIRFDGHPNLKRILLPEDWEGHPLRKDYIFPTEYHGISLEVDPPWPTE